MAERITSISTLFFAPYLSAMPPRRGLRTRPAQGMSAKMMPIAHGSGVDPELAADQGAKGDDWAASHPVQQVVQLQPHK